MSIVEIQGWLGTILAMPGLGAILLVLLVYFGAKTIYALIETVEELEILEKREKAD